MQKAIKDYDKLVMWVRSEIEISNLDGENNQNYLPRFRNFGFHIQASSFSKVKTESSRAQSHAFENTYLYYYWYQKVTKYYLSSNLIVV